MLGCAAPAPVLPGAAFPSPGPAVAQGAGRWSGGEGRTGGVEPERTPGGSGFSRWGEEDGDTGAGSAAGGAARPP